METVYCVAVRGGSGGGGGGEGSTVLVSLDTSTWVVVSPYATVASVNAGGSSPSLTHASLS